MSECVCECVCESVCVCVCEHFAKVEEDTCMSYEEEDTCMSHEEEDTCMSHQEEDTCLPVGGDHVQEFAEVGKGVRGCACLLLFSSLVQFV